MRIALAAALLLLAQPACSGRPISSWAPSGSLDWDDRPQDLDEPADGGEDGPPADAAGSRAAEDPAGGAPARAP